MKKLFTYSVLALFVIVPGILSTAYGQWKQHIIDDNLNSAEIVRVADINGDNKPDVITTDYFGC